MQGALAPVHRDLQIHRNTFRAEVWKDMYLGKTGFESSLGFMNVNYSYTSKSVMSNKKGSERMYKVEWQASSNDDFLDRAK